MPRNRHSKSGSFAVKVYVNSLQYDYRYPWKAPKINVWTGSGFIIDGNRIITNAHVAGGAVFIEVQVANDSVKYQAKLKALGNNCDLAELAVDDPEFWKKTKSLPIGYTPQQGQKVWVHGFPIGGEGYCITDGIVSRQESSTYVHGEHMLLSSQLSAAINPGNSGGAVVSNGKVVGVVHQGIPGRQNIGYMIPASVLSHFLEQVETHNMGFPTLDLTIQKLENVHLRKHYQLYENESGILVKDIPKLSCADGILKPNDIIMSVNGYRVANDGTINYRDVKHIDFNYYINSRRIGDEITFKILRENKVVYETLRLDKAFDEHHMIYPRTWGVAPTYYIIPGGLVVQPVSKNYIDDAKCSIRNKEKQNPDDEIVVLNTVLKNEYTQGYDYANCVIDKVNGIKINNLKELIKAIEENTNWSNQIELQSGDLIVIPRLNTFEAKKLLDSYQIPKDRSDDLPKAVEAKQLKNEYISAASFLPKFSSLLSDETDKIAIPLQLSKESDKKHVRYH